MTPVEGTVTEALFSGGSMTHQGPAMMSEEGTVRVEDDAQLEDLQFLEERIN